MANVDGCKIAITLWADEVRRIALDFALEETRRAAPVASGATRDGLVLERTDLGGIISDAVPQAEFTDKGTSGPYTISGNPLVFYWANGPQGAKTYFYRFVTHPGIRAQNWFEEPMPQRWEDGLNTAASFVESER